MRPMSYTQQHLQNQNMQPMSGELSGSLGGVPLYGGASLIATIGVALMFMNKNTKEYAPLAGAFLAGHFLGGTLLSI